MILLVIEYFFMLNKKSSFVIFLFICSKTIKRLLVLFSVNKEPVALCSLINLILETFQTNTPLKKSADNIKAKY